MTDHNTHGHRAGHSDRDSDGALDAVLTATSGRLLAHLQATLDIDAGLAAIHATDPTLAEPPDTSARGTEPAHGELGAVCQVLAGYLADLEPAADIRSPATMSLGRSFMYLSAVHRLVAELQHGLLTRTVDRNSADRLVRLIEHNATEAKYLLAADRSRARRRAHTQIDTWADIVAGIRDGITALRPRIRALFEDAGQDAPHHPAPRLPV